MKSWGIFFTSVLSGALAVSGAAEESTWMTRLEALDRTMLACMNMQPQGENEKVSIRLHDPEDNRYLELTFGNGGGTQCALVPEQAFPKELRRCLRTMPCPERTGDAPYWLTFKRSENFWGIYVGDQLIFRSPELWPGAVAVCHLPEALPEEGAKDDYTQRFGSFTFTDDFLVPAGSAFPPSWEIIGGTWKLHSVTGSITGAASGYNQLARQPLPEKSPNFYSFEGGGSNAVVLAGEYFYSHYLCRAAVQHNTGTNGIVFLAGEHGGYLAFTARTDHDTDRIILDLWRQPAENGAAPVPLAAVKTDLPLGQWLLLEAQLFDDRIICRADNIEVIRLRLDLPPGGRFGFFSNMPDKEKTRFDDILVTTHGDKRFESVEDVLDATRRQTAGTRAFPHKDGSIWLYFPPCADAQTNAWTFGAANAMPLRQETTFVATSDTFTCGLTLGDPDASDKPFFRFSCAQADGKRTYLLEVITNNAPPLLIDSFETAFTSNRVTLAIDPLKPNDFRCLADGKTVCFRRPATQPSGRLGVFAENTSDLFFTAPAVTSQDTVMPDRFEKNPLYVNDPFMKNWASPEGAWITLPDGLTWFKGDLLGPTKIRLPLTAGSELHLFIPEGETNGLCRIRTQELQVSVYTPASGDEPAFVVPIADIPYVSLDRNTRPRLLTIGINDHILWLGSDEALLARTHLPELPRGRRMRIAGLTAENLKPTLSQTLVKRENVFDTLFTESLFNWTLNGGIWEVINRFYCEPTWSHMNGENDDGIAALWSKYVFSGDFSVDFYAGMRMGWYERAGDLNLSIMSHQNATCDGYTAIATGWDPDYSQLYSRLLRNGDVIDSSTKYMVPRIREGNDRRDYEPDIAVGRPMHGAWYGIQFRRVGNRLQYIYGNETVFEADDPNPLQGGSLGMWTYRNSMMVARIRIAAEHIQPRAFAFKPIPPGPPPAPREAPLPDPGTRINGRPLQPLAATHWEADDPVSNPHIRFTGQNTAKPEMRVTSVLGAGSFLARCTLPPAPPDKLLGWQFEIARHPDARVNFEFSTVKPDGKGGLTQLQGWTYILNGSDETRGPRKIIGTHGHIPPSPPDATNGSIVWTPVEVWIPSDIFHDGNPVQIEGFGNLQPSDIQQGLLGNPPNAWYAIRNFREVHRGTPALTAPPDKRAELNAFTETIGSLRPGELQMLEVPASLDPRRPVIEWAVPELATFGLRATADPKVFSSILVTPTHPWPSPVLPPRDVTVDAAKAPFVTEGNSLRVLVPYDQLKPDRMTLSLTLADGRIFRQVVQMRQTGSASTQPPVLISIEMPDGGGLNTFEERPYDPAPHQISVAATIDYSDPIRGGTLRFANGGVQWRRLLGQLVPKFDPMVTPVIQFRYKADPMASVGLDFGGQNFLSFIENYHGKFARPNTALAPADNQWHVFTALLTDGLGELPLTHRTSIPASYIRIRSLSPGVDLTGRHSSILIDDLVCGPAVGPSRPLAFKANYADPSGTIHASYTIIPGWPAYDSRPEDERAQILAASWTPAPNAEVVVPDIKALESGPHHLLIRAKNANGDWSHPADIPFIAIQTPPAISAAIVPTDKYNGSCLTLNITSPTTLPNINTLRLSCLGTPLPLHTDNGKLAILINAHYEIDWTWLLRKHLANVKHGDTLPLTIDGITDAAGNAAPPYRVDIPIIKEGDTRPPSIVPPPDPTNALCFAPTVTLLKNFFPTLRNGTSAVVQTDDGPALTITTDADPCTFQHAFATAWSPSKHPWLHLSYRTPPGSTAPPFSITFNTGPVLPRAAAAARAGARGNARDNQTLNLTAPAPYIVGDPTPTPGEWKNLMVNVRDFIRDQAGGNADISSITINIASKARGSKIQFRAFSILAPWAPADILPVRAYDINGVKGLIWGADGFSPHTAIRPASLGLANDQGGGFAFRVSDGVGNLTETWVIPVPPTTAKPTLPPFEPVP